MTDVATPAVQLEGEQAPVAPPRRKKKKRKVHRLESENSIDIDSEVHNNTTSLSRQSSCSTETVEVPKAPPRMRRRASTLENAIDGGEPASSTSLSSLPLRSTEDSGSGSETDKDSAILGSSKRKMMLETSSFRSPSQRVQNYYSGAEMRRQSVPSTIKRSQTEDAPAVCSASAGLSRSKSLAPSDADPYPEERYATPPLSSDSLSGGKKSRPPPRPSAAPSRPPRQIGCRNKTATYSQLYAPGDRSNDATAAEKNILVIDTKHATREKQTSHMMKAYRGQEGEPHNKTKQEGHRDDPSHAYGRKTQAALNKLASTVKMFSKSSSVVPMLAQKSKALLPKVPPKRPPPAVRNTPRPPIPNKLDGVEENFYDNQYEDHIYMEIGMSGRRSKTAVTCVSEACQPAKEEDPYVIMNAGDGSEDSSNIYTPLDFSKLDDNIVYEVVQVPRGKEDSSNELEASGEYENYDNTYISQEELQRSYERATACEGHTPYQNVSHGGSTQGLNTSVYDEETLKRSPEKENDTQHTLHAQSTAVTHTL